MSSRRDFLKNIGVATASLTLASCNVINEQPERREGDSTKRVYVFFLGGGVS